MRSMVPQAPVSVLSVPISSRYTMGRMYASSDERRQTEKAVSLILFRTKMGAHVLSASSRQRASSSVTRGTSSFILSQVEIVGRRKFLTTTGNTARYFTNVHTRSGCSAQETATSEASVRQHSTNLPAAARASQYRTAARPSRKTSKKEMVVSSGVKTSSSGTRASRNSGTCSKIEVATIPQTSKSASGIAMSDVLRPRKDKIMRKLSGSYGIAAESHAASAASRSGCSRASSKVASGAGGLCMEPHSAPGNSGRSKESKSA
mmetsp:Transcript_975/g.2667  ORF Transcript_975/g.2667 Transcript_975/m.2667 type:complete len:262 (-) Transcript_975:57-842(-)